MNIDWTQTWAVILTGIIVTFVVLLALWFFVALMGKVINAITGTKKKTTSQTPIIAAETIKPQQAVAQDDTDIIAVIMAAISAMGNGYTLRSIKRTSDGAEIWASAGRTKNSAGV